MIAQRLVKRFKMKSLRALLFLIIGSAGLEIHFSPKYEDQIAAVRRECAKKEGVDPKFLQQLDGLTENFPKMEELKCHSLCILKTFDVLDDEQRMRTDRMREWFNPQFLDKFLKILDSCLPEDKRIGSCEVAYKMHRCVIEKS